MNFHSHVISGPRVKSWLPYCPSKTPKSGSWNCVDLCFNWSFLLGKSFFEVIVKTMVIFRNYDELRQCILVNPSNSLDRAWMNVSSNFVSLSSQQLDDDGKWQWTDMKSSSGLSGAVGSNWRCVRGQNLRWQAHVTSLWVNAKCRPGLFLWMQLRVCVGAFFRVEGFLDPFFPQWRGMFWMLDYFVSKGS